MQLDLKNAWTTFSWDKTGNLSNVRGKFLSVCPDDIVMDVRPETYLNGQHSVLPHIEFKLDHPVSLQNHHKLQNAIEFPP